LGYFLSSIFESTETATVMVGVIVLPLILFGGLFINVGTMPAWIGWLQYVCPIRFAMEIFVRTEYEAQKNLDFDIITFLGYDYGSGTCWIVMIALALGFRILAYIFLKLLIRKFQ
jgi:ABC-type multidrug transport system permease subunit